jgi:cytosine/adenosine deaminase-related metal-dependent hydrolase
MANGWPPSKWRSHVLCGALAATAHAMDAAEDKAKELIAHGVTTALTSAGVPSPVAGMAARAAVDTLAKLPAYTQWDAVRRGSGC